MPYPGGNWSCCMVGRAGPAHLLAWHWEGLRGGCLSAAGPDSGRRDEWSALARRQLCGRAFYRAPRPSRSSPKKYPCTILAAHAQRGQRWALFPQGGGWVWKGFGLPYQAPLHAGKINCVRRPAARVALRGLGPRTVTASGSAQTGGAGGRCSGSGGGGGRACD